MSQGDLSKQNKDGAGNAKTASVELKNGKVVFKQKIISFEKLSETLQEIVSFRAMLEQRVARNDSPLPSIPEEHQPVIVKLSLESDKSLGVLAKHVRQQLLPVLEESVAGSSAISPAMKALPTEVIENVIKAVMIRTNYGLDNTVASIKIPAALCIWRWEVRNEYRHWLPKAAQQHAEARLAEREQAKKDLLALVAELPAAERDVLLDPKKNKAKDANPMEITYNFTKADIIEKTAKLDSSNTQKENKGDIEIDSPRAAENDKSSRGRKKDPEKEAKEKERLEKKAAKAEKDKKLQEQENKSRSLMANFFGKKKSPTAVSNPSSSLRVASPDAQSEFQRTFRPFVTKKDVEMAPVNWFLHTRERRRTKQRFGETTADVVIIDEDQHVSVPERPGRSSGTSGNIEVMSAKERLRCILSTLPPGTVAQTERPIRITTRALMAQLNEAEVGGDIALVRHILSILRSRTRLPAKVFIFTEDSRPGYFGTWTQQSHVIRPRKPFARDVVARDYGYDSGEEWEDEGEGEGVEDADIDEEPTAGEEDDSDLDGWLVDDDEIIEDEAGLPPLPFEPEIMIMPPPPAPKRKVEDPERNAAKKRKVVVPLVPYAKGPCWETEIGRCEHDVLEGYRIQLFNDTPYPIDPFTFVTADVVEKKHDATARNPADVQASGRIPSPPQTFKGVMNPKRAAVPLAPKTAFPTVHLPILLSKIQTLSTGNLTFIIESIYAELHNSDNTGQVGGKLPVKKNAIEAKVREVAEKCKDKKVWVVKEGYRLAHVDTPVPENSYQP